jgi:hypothetical protein
MPKTTGHVKLKAGDKILAWNDNNDSTESGVLVKLGCCIDDSHPVLMENENGHKKSYQNCMRHPEA